METGLPFFLIGTGLEGIFFIWGIVMKKIPHWAIIAGSIVNGLFVVIGVLLLLPSSMVSGFLKPQPVLEAWSWLIPLIMLILIIVVVGPPNIIDSVTDLFDKIMRIRIVSKPPEKDKNEPIAYLFPLDPSEAIHHLLISSREVDELSIFRGISGCPIEYPIKLLNTRPVRLEIIGFTVNILMNDKPVQVIKWDKPDNQTSNGTPINHPCYLEGDRLTKLHFIRVVLTQISTVLPNESPYWGIQGEMRFQGKDTTVIKGFDFSNDHYILLQDAWDDVKKRALP